MQLFEDDWGVDNSPPDNTEITTTILYFSKEELAKFKSLCKVGIKTMYGNDAQTKGNLSDFLLTILENNYANIHAEKNNDNSAS
jgi:hypothetical protein